MRKLLIILSLIVVIFLFLTLYITMTDVMANKDKQVELSERIVALERQNLVHQVEAETSVSLANRMSSLQLYTEKLALSGQAENWAMADYYTAKVREELVAIERMDAVFGEQTINTFLRGTSLKVLEDLEKNAGGPLEGFNTGYKRFIRSCNACHESTGVGYLRIKVPKGDPFVGQYFKPGKE